MDTSSCPGCGQAVSASERIFCPSCGTAQHKSCVDAKGSCASCGASFAAPVASPGPAPAAPVHTQPCKNCQKPVQTGLSKCPHCGAAISQTSMGKILLLIGCVCMVMVVPVMGILAAILVPNFIKARSQGQLTSCKSNLKNIATACEMYSTDNVGRYPTDLGALTPNYLKIIPNCPAAEQNTYSGSYEVGAEPDAFTVFCQGENHKMMRLPANYPQYNSYTGLVDRAGY